MQPNSIPPPPAFRVLKSELSYLRVLRLSLSRDRTLNLVKLPIINNIDYFLDKGLLKYLVISQFFINFASESVRGLESPLVFLRISNLFRA